MVNWLPWPVRSLRESLRRDASTISLTRVSPRPQPCGLAVPSPWSRDRTPRRLWHLFGRNADPRVLDLDFDLPWFHSCPDRDPDAHEAYCAAFVRMTNQSARESDPDRRAQMGSWLGISIDRSIGSLMESREDLLSGRLSDRPQPERGDRQRSRGTDPRDLVDAAGVSHQRFEPAEGAADEIPRLVRHRVSPWSSKQGSTCCRWPIMETAGRVKRAARTPSESDHCPSSLVRLAHRFLEACHLFLTFAKGRRYLRGQVDGDQDRGREGEQLPVEDAQAPRMSLPREGTCEIIRKTRQCPSRRP